LIKGVPSNYPLTIFSHQNSDISHIINFEAVNTEPIIIYVSRGQDVSFNNGDFFRFYDKNYQLLNINHRYRTIYDSSLTDVRSNFYFMNARTYIFRTTTDFCGNFQFTISGSSLTSSYNYSLNAIDNSFTITIPASADNSTNKLFYSDNDNDVSGNLYILRGRDVSNLKYYYGDISFSIRNYNDFSSIKLSIKSYDFSYGTNVPSFGNKEISNNNFFYYSSICSYINNNNLANNNEFLNKVSAIDISYIAGDYKLSFNKNRHSTYTTNIYDLSFGLGPGSYVIIDVSINFPIRLINQDISNLITIDRTYQPTRLKEYVNVNTNKTYYYGSFKVNVFADFSSVNIAFLNRTINPFTEREYISKFFYTEIPHLETGTYGPITTSYLKLITQEGNYYDLSQSVYNKYDLNLDSRYIEKFYIAADKYGHNLNTLDFITSIPASEQAINDDISNNIVSGTGLLEYNILYRVTDYENITIKNIRTVVVNCGPIIEISSNYFQNNQYNNILQFQTNTFNPSYNFYDNIKVYIYDTSKQRINIPFEVSISGNYINSIRNTQLLQNNINFSYTETNPTKERFLAHLNKNYYAYYNNIVGFRNTNNDTITIRNYSSPIINDNSFSKIIGNLANTLTIDTNANEIRIGSASKSIFLNNIEQSFDSSSITLYFNSVYRRSAEDSQEYPITCGLKLNNYSFELSCNSIYVSDNFKVTGRFKPINFFGDSAAGLIDISYIGSYNLQISTKGLSGGDYFYDTYKTRFFKQTIFNRSKTYTINIQDISSPVLTFYNKNIVGSNTSTTYLYSFPRLRKFNILQDICFVDLRITPVNNYVSNKPLIQYRDNSIYDFSYGRDITFTLIGVGSGTNITHNITAKELSLNSIIIDSSCIINYRAKDICNNYSQDISLILNFVNIPYAELSGNAIANINFSRNSTYSDAGIIIYNDPTTSRLFIPRTISGSIVNEISNITLGTSYYDICYNTDLCLNIIGDYSFNYIVTISNSSTRVPLILKRQISIRDISNPYFLFQDFSSINYTLNDARLGNNSMATYDASYTSSTRIIHSDTNSFNIDFSFVVYRTFEELSKVLYDFDVSDNYQQKSNIIKTLTFNTNPSSFTFNDISNYFDTSQNRRLNKVTKSRYSTSTLPRLVFKYTINDSYNTYNVTRNVDIIDDTRPTIEFSFNNYYANNYQYVYFDNSRIDFSYVALDYSKQYYANEPSYDFVQELSSILFNIDLSDNFDLKSAINYQITISNNIYRTGITNINDLSNSIKALFSMKDTSFTLIYDISDNQFNTFQSKRNVKIIDISTNLDISFLNNSSTLTVSFGDTNFNILRELAFNHRRLTTTSISFDISYILPSTITSISGTSLSLFDPSALIYRMGDNSVNYFPSAYSSSFYSKRRIINIVNNGPLISFPSTGISHEIYTPLIDASLIFGVTSNSVYDAFTFKNYKPELSYNGTNFEVTFDSCLNILEPSFGIYNVYYRSTDLYGTTSNRTRILDVADRRPPLITICGDSFYELSGNTYYIPDKSIYVDYGAYAYDQGTRTYDISIIKITQRKYLNTLSYETISNEILTLTPLSYASNVSYRIIYSVTDRFSNSQDICRNIVINPSNNPKLYPYIEVSSSAGIVEYDLYNDISINTRLINTTITGLGYPYYDLSLSFIYDKSVANNQTIICEGIMPNVFAKAKPDNYVKFKLRATTSNDVILADSYVNVEFETIDSLNIHKTNKIYFYARDVNQNDAIDQISFLEYNLKFVDTTPPVATLLNNRNFENISNLNYPLLSRTSINDLSTNINSYANFNNLYNNYENYFDKVLNNIVIFDPGINIRDIVSGQVNYINNNFKQVGDSSYNFNSSDITIKYYKVDGSLIDVCNILFDGCSNNFTRNYTQSYNVRDRQGNYSIIIPSRNINVTRFQPFINLYYQTDCCNNNYITYNHKIFEKYVELGGRVLDYFDGLAKQFESVNITNNLNENRIGAYNINYDVSNSANIISTTQRKVNVITTLPLQQQYTYNFNDILNFSLSTVINKSYTKYSLYNGSYNFEVPRNLGFNIITQEFDICNGIYIISDVVSITSDSSFNANNKKFYYNNVTLTLSGDFNRLSIELSNNSIYSNIFVYDSKNTYIDLYDVVNNNENDAIIDTSYVVDISNLNNPNSSPYFVFFSTTDVRDLHLSIGNYRFYQYGYKNFHNPIKFSITKDGIHNGGIEYTKNIFRRNLPGVSILNRTSNSSYTQINIDATTPATLYYYCENFPNMGGRIQIKNNIIFSKQTIILNNYIIDSDSETKILNSNYLPDNVLKDRVVLTQRFRVSGGDSSFVNITCITQRNIQHNMLYNINQHPHKLIIRKHTDLLERTDVSFVVNNYSSIMRNNAVNYLFENRGTIFNFSNTYINLFKYEFDSSLNISRRMSDPLLDTYDEDIRQIFYNYKNYNFLKAGSNQLLDEIVNYSDFFRANKLLTKTLLVDSFKYKISEFFFANSSKVLNLDINNEYNYNERLLAPRIRITNITGNYVTFILEIYYNNNNNWYLSNDILRSNKEILFGTYEYIIYSDIFTQNLNASDLSTERDFITFYNGSLTITSNLIYSYNAELSNNFYNSRIFDIIEHNDFSNTIFLSMKDTSNNLASVCGLTKRNLYNNVYFDENQTLIFHRFSEETIINYQVNTPTLTLEDTLREEINNDNYLIDICNNDIYNFYDSKALNFKTLRDLSSNENYNVYIAYAINEQVSISNNYLSLFDIEPIYLNNMPIKRIGYIYRQYSEYALNSYDNSINTITDKSYNSIENRLSSHSYIIDLNDYFDINIFKNTLLATNLYLTDFINLNKLSYSLLDISFTIPFNLYDISGSQSVIFNYRNLNLLLTMRNRVLPLYYKLTYMIKVFTISFPNISNNNVTLSFKYDDNINYYINLLREDPLNYIVDTYTNEVTVDMLTELYKEIFDNIQSFLLIFNTVITSYNIRHNYLVNISNFLNLVIDFNYINIDYLDNLITLLESNVENILDNMMIYLGENNIIEMLDFYNLTSNVVLDSGNILTNSDISYLDYCFKAYYILNNNLDLMRKEVEVRNYDYSIRFESYRYEIASNITSNSQKRYKNLFTTNNLDATKLYNDLKYNFNLLNSNFILDYSYVLHLYANVTYYYSPYPGGTNNIVNYQPYYDASIVNYATLYTNVNNLYNIITSVYNILSNDYNITNKPIIYLNSQYNFIGSKLLINSYYSNSIILKLNIKYKKSLYEIIDLSNVYLDITIPDLTPPTIIFNNTSDICFNEKVFSLDSDVSALVSTKLINDLSYIDLDQSYTITFASRKYYDTKNITYVLTSINNSNYSLSLLEIDFTDISNPTFNDSPYIYTYIKYILLDNANNKNTIMRRILLENDNIEPIFFYKSQNNSQNNIWRPYKSASNIGTGLTARASIIINQDITQAAFIERLTSSVRIVNPLLHERKTDLFSLVYSDIQLETLLIDASLIPISYIKILENNTTILQYNSGQPILNFNSIINNEMLNASKNNNLFIEYVTDTIVYSRSGQLRIKLEIIPNIIVISETKIIDTHCCYPKVGYKAIQDNYKLGSQNTTVMRMAKFLINRHN